MKRRGSGDYESSSRPRSCRWPTASGSGRGAFDWLLAAMLITNHRLPSGRKGMKAAAKDLKRAARDIDQETRTCCNRRRDRVKPTYAPSTSASSRMRVCVQQGYLTLPAEALPGGPRRTCAGAMPDRLRGPALGASTEGVFYLTSVGPRAFEPPFPSAPSALGHNAFIGGRRGAQRLASLLHVVAGAASHGTCALCAHDRLNAYGRVRRPSAHHEELGQEMKGSPQPSTFSGQPGHPGVIVSMPSTPRASNPSCRTSSSGCTTGGDRSGRP